MKISSNPPISLPTSLSRRLRTSGSIKGGASPATFPATGKKRGSGFNNPEPSSPKVTCIGQVRVKSKKKQAKKLKTEISFRKLEHQNQEQRSNQRWVHFPVTICEALRTFGSEFSCLFPCRSSCFSKEEKAMAAPAGEGHRRGSCCAFARWLVAVQDADRDIELVVEEEDDSPVKKSRRHVFEDLEIVNEEARVSICVPPKNALLLMRCRSDPMKMEALASRNWEPAMAKNDEEFEEFVDDEEQIEEKEVDLKETHEDLQVMVMEEDEDQEQEDSMFLGLLFEEIVDQDHEIQEPDEEIVDQDHEIQEPDEEIVAEESTTAIESTERSETHEEQVVNNGVLEREIEERERRRLLPECLLTMMYEPKLSMEVSKETWVCSTDFIRRQSSRKKPPPAPETEPAPVKVDTAAVATTTYNVIRPPERLYQPARSSCSLPAPPSMAAMIEQKLVRYEPFVLTRCKSEPMKTAAAKLAPETCFWENQELERLGRVTFGVGAAGLGF